jgi:hypothetical protein
VDLSGGFVSVILPNGGQRSKCGVDEVREEEEVKKGIKG